MAWMQSLTQWAMPGLGRLDRLPNRASASAGHHHSFSEPQGGGVERPETP